MFESEFSKESPYCMWASQKLWQTFNNVIALQYYNVIYGFLFIILVYYRT